MGGFRQNHRKCSEEKGAERKQERKGSPKKGRYEALRARGLRHAALTLLPAVARKNLTRKEGTKTLTALSFAFGGGKKNFGATTGPAGRGEIGVVFGGGWGSRVTGFRIDNVQEGRGWVAG